MADSIQIEWSSAMKLMPILLELKDKFRAKEEVDLREYADRVGSAFGIEDIDAFAMDRLHHLMSGGMAVAGDRMDGEAMQTVADIFTDCAAPVMSAVVGFAKGGMTSKDLVMQLSDINMGCVDQVHKSLQVALGVPDEAAELLSKKLGPYLTSIYAFSAAYKIYQGACHDYEVARERRMEAERLAQAAILEIKERRAEMDAIVSDYMLARLVPFDEGIRAMDQAILDSDDDGFIKANAELWKLFGRETQYTTAEEFDDLMLSGVSFKL